MDLARTSWTAIGPFAAIVSLDRGTKPTGRGSTRTKEAISVEATHRPSRPRKALGVAVALSQHADKHRPERPILLAVDQQLGEGATLRVAPELADPVGPFEVKAGR
jgi:hypothetical protein